MAQIFIDKGSLVDIAADSFLNCPNLKTIIIPKSVTQIRDSALGFLFDKQTNKYSQMDDLTILCAPNSEGERYAKDNHFSYRLASRLSVITDMQQRQLSLKNRMISRTQLYSHTE